MGNRKEAKPVKEKRAKEVAHPKSERTAEVEPDSRWGYRAAIGIGIYLVVVMGVNVLQAALQPAPESPLGPEA
eukprot:3762254-Rhodomonas_salina.4